MAVETPIFPNYGQGQTVATSASPVSATVPANIKSLLLTVTGTQPVYFRVTDITDTSVATAADCLVNSVNRMLVSKADQTRISVVSPGGASSVHIIPCEGSFTM